MSRSTLLTWGRVLATVVAFGLIVWRLGAGPFVDGLRTINAGALAAAAGLGLLATLCCAWRWRVVARGLGIELSLAGAVSAYYRSQFLNVTLPGGVVGDVHRGVSHGRENSDVGRGLRAVAWERSAGQVVQVVLTVIVLLALASPLHSAMPWAALGVAVGLVAVVLVARARPGGGRSLRARVHGAVVSDLRGGLLARRAWPAIVVASAIVVAAHALTFLIAARTAGSTASVSKLLPIALIVMAAMVIPSVGGWGPREGVAAWAFAAAGLGAQQGVSTSVVYGVMALVACLPGAAVVGVAWFRSSRSAVSPEPPLREGAAHA
jgi:glycosyltransferase 2 family protein